MLLYLMCFFILTKCVVDRKKFTDYLCGIYVLFVIIFISIDYLFHGKLLFF